MHPPLSRSRAALLTGLLVALGCATNPLTGESHLMLISEEREKELGLEAVDQVRGEFGLLENPALEAYVEQVGERLRAVTPAAGAAPYSYALVDQPEPNAFAAPGGHIFVSRGLLALVNSEDELASVIGHEIAHVVARHSARRMSTALGVTVLALPLAVGGAIAGGEAGAQLVGQLVGAGGMLFVAGHSRDHERESDYYGQGFAHAAGYDPTAAVDFFSTMDSVQVLMEGKPRMPGWLDTHPATPERIQNTRQRADGLLAGAAPPARTPPAELLARLEGLPVGPSPALGLFREQTFLHPDMDFHLQFPSGWETANTNQAVAAATEAGDALMMLDLAEGADPRSAAQAQLQNAGVVPLEEQALVIGGRQAYRVRMDVEQNQIPLSVEMHMIAHGGMMLRVLGFAAQDVYPRYERVLRSSAQSFRGLTRGERASIEWKRLHVVRARAGESLAQLSARSSNAWSVEETAAANALAADARLQAGQAVKIARSERYPGP